MRSHLTHIQIEFVVERHLAKVIENRTYKNFAVIISVMVVKIRTFITSFYKSFNLVKVKTNKENSQLNILNVLTNIMKTFHARFGSVTRYEWNIFYIVKV